MTKISAQLINIPRIITNLPITELRTNFKRRNYCERDRMLDTIVKQQKAVKYFEVLGQD